MFVYFFLNAENDIIYIGRTKYLYERMKRHFNDSHLPTECISETVNILYSKFQSENEMKIFEMYYISRYKPKYNKDFMKGGEVSIRLPVQRLRKFEFS